MALTDDSVKVVGHANSRIEHLAAIGFETQAIRFLEVFLDRLPKTNIKEFVPLALLGATIGLDLPSNRNTTKFLGLAEARAAIGKPNSKAMKSIQEFRESNGLIDREFDEYDEMQYVAEFGKRRRDYHAAIKLGDQDAALKALNRMGAIIPPIDSFYIEAKLILSVIKGYQRLNAHAALLKYVRWIDNNHHENNLKNGNLFAMGLPEIAVDRASKLIQKNLKDLRTSDDVNIHFPVNDIRENLDFLIHVGEKAKAQKLLDQTLKEMPQWRGMAPGFATSGVLTELAEVMADLGMREEASQFLTAAVGTGRSERNAGFRKSAVKSAMESSAATGGTTDAIERARSIRSASSRRKALVPLLTKIGDWKELKKTLNEVTTAKEAAVLCREVIYAFPSGIWL
jgi:tetratricopeptide (TPR) repeat protein